MTNDDFPNGEPEQIHNAQLLKRVLSRRTLMTKTVKGIAFATSGFAIAHVLSTSASAQTSSNPTLTLLSGWMTYGYGYAAPSVIRDGSIVQISGLIKGGMWGSLASLSRDAAPAERLIFYVNNHENITRVDVLSNGLVVYAGGSTNHGWVSLEGIRFIPSGGSALTLLNGWSNYGYGYAPATAARSGNTVVVQGLVRKSGVWDTSAPITTLPEGMRPAQRMTFGGCVHTSAARIDILPNGEVFYITGKANWDWLSLSGITFTVGSTTSLTLASGWSNFGNGYAPQGIATTGALRPCSGVLTGNSGLIATLPAGIPGITAGWRIFSVLRGDRPSRVDLQPDGRLFHIAGGNPGLTSLSNIILNQ